MIQITVNDIPGGKTRCSLRKLLLLLKNSIGFTDTVCCTLKNGTFTDHLFLAENTQQLWLWPESPTQSQHTMSRGTSQGLMYSQDQMSGGGSGWRSSSGNQLKQRNHCNSRKCHPEVNICKSKAFLYPRSRASSTTCSITSNELKGYGENQPKSKKKNEMRRIIKERKQEKLPHPQFYSAVLWSHLLGTWQQ